MKKIILSAALMAGIAGAKAQNLSLGPVVGLNHSWMTNTGNDREFNPGLNTGARLTYSFNPAWGVGADLLFSMNGMKQKAVTNGISTTHTTHLNFVRFEPKVIRFFGDLGDAVRPKLFAGASLGALVGGDTEMKIGAPGDAGHVTNTSPSKDHYNSFDAGFLVGGGVNWRIGKATWLNTDLVYSNGLVDLSKSNSGWNASRSVALNVGVTFPIGTVEPR